ncbi:MAG: hypothetical protein H6Q54_1172 [Deltaproteobacteria bacterium]|nr:hypothetical protein [Deltaproteobacteria bacterium]
MASGFPKQTPVRRGSLVFCKCKSSEGPREHKPAHSWARGGGYTDPGYPPSEWVAERGATQAPVIELPDSDAHHTGKSGVEE